MSRIMVIEDEGDLREIIVDLLSAENFEVIGTPDAQTAINLIEGGYSPNLIICDLNMPGLSGEEFIQRMVLKSSQSLIAVLSGFDDQERIIECMNLGAADFLTKPVDHKELVDKVYVMIERQKAKILALSDPTRSRHYENLLKIRQSQLTRSRKSPS